MISTVQRVTVQNVRVTDGHTPWRQRFLLRWKMFTFDCTLVSVFFSIALASGNASHHNTFLFNIVLLGVWLAMIAFKLWDYTQEPVLTADKVREQNAAALAELTGEQK